MYKVLHLIPYDGIGGVEIAAHTMMNNTSHDEIQFKVDFIFKNKQSTKGIWRTFFLFFTSAWQYSKKDVNLLVVSLWRASIVGVLVKFLRPNIKLVTFLHSCNDAHIIDRMVTRLSISVSNEIWADSQATIDKQSHRISTKKCQVISFVTRYFDPLPQKTVEPVFIFWGRLARSKAIDRAIHIFSAIFKEKPSARFLIVGPDGGELHVLQDLCESLGLKNAITFLGAATQDEIVAYSRQACFYLQTSLYEGMAMAVVESMQIGLIPVVTPVGEICAYCHKDFNAILVESDQQAVNDVLRLLDLNDLYHEMRNNAIATWRDHPLYHDSILDACRHEKTGTGSKKRD